MSPSLTSTALLVTTALLVGLTAVAWRNRAKPGVKLFGVYLALSAVWAGVTVVGLALSPGPVRLRVWGFTTGMSLVVVVFWFAFVLRYTGRDQWLTLRRFGLASIPLIVTAGVYFVSPGWPRLAGPLTQETTTIGTVVRPSIGLVGAVVGVYIYLVFAVGLVLVLKTALEGPGAFVGQALALVLGSLVPIVASFLEILGVPTSGYPLTQVALSVQSVLWGYAVFGQQFMQIVPAVRQVGREAALDDIDDGVLVVDGDGTITSANSRARSHLDADDLVGESVDVVLDRTDAATLADLPAQSQHQGRTYRVKASPVTDWHGQAVGHALVVQDVTSLVRRQQRLQVLNRVLRHNVRNDMNVVIGVARQLQTRADDDLATMGQTLSRKSRNLLTVSEKAIEIDRVFDDGNAVERVALPALVDDVVTALDHEYPGGTITTTVAPDEGWTDPRILSLVLEEVVANALEHAGDAPEVHVDISRTNTVLRVAVSDNGPGIPQSEVDPIVVGEETDLMHASGVGLWLVYWVSSLSAATWISRPRRPGRR